MVIFVGDVGAGDRSNLQYIDQEALVRATGAAFARVDSPSDAGEATRRAFYQARVERIPVVLDVPMDVQELDYPGPWTYEPSTLDLVGLQRIQPTAEALDEAVAIISASSRPVVVAGRRAVSSADSTDVQEFAARIGALTGVTLPARGWLQGDPHYLGIVGLFSSLAAAELLAQADCIIALGASLNYYTTEGGYLFPNAQVVQIDLDQEHLMGTGRRADCYVIGDVSTTLTYLMKELPVSDDMRFRNPEVASTLADAVPDYVRRPFEIEPDTVDPRHLCESLDSLLPDDVGLVIGAGHFWSFPVMHMQKWRAQFHYTLDFGSIGQGLPAAMGAAAGGRNQRTALVEGDGSFMMHVQELETAARYRLPLLVVVLNDRALGAEYHKLSARGLDADLGLMPSTDLAGLARSLGCQGTTVRSVEELAPAVERFLETGEPMVIDVITSRAVISMPYWRTQFGRD